MNIIESLYEDEDLSTDEGIEAICEKIKNLNVSQPPSNSGQLKVLRQNCSDRFNRINL